MMLDETAAQSMMGPPSIDGIGPAATWDDYWKSCDVKRRAESEWAAGPASATK
jgi:hypothetical protein